MKAKPSFFLFNKRNFRKPARSSAVIRERHGDRSLRVEHVVTGRFRMAGILDDSPAVWLIGATVEQTEGEAMEPGTYFLSREDTETNGSSTCGTVVNMTQAEKKSDGALRLNPRSSTSSFLSRVIGACLAVLLWGADAQAQDEVAALLNLSPWQSYVHLFCDKTGGADCAVTFRCGQQSGDPVTWPVEVEPSRIFTYWPNKTDGFGRPAGLEAALVNAGLTSTEARRRTTCTVRSDDPVEARAYTFFAGELTPVANIVPRAGDDNKVATLLNLSPWRSYVHLFCDKTGGADCAVTFRCGQQSGDPVTWPVEVEPSRIFTYWPNKTDGFGRPAGLEAALVNAGLTSTEARRRTTCTVRSDDPVKARAYTFIAGQFIPVANVNTVASSGPRQPSPRDNNLYYLVGLDVFGSLGGNLFPPFHSNIIDYAGTVTMKCVATTLPSGTVTYNCPDSFTIRANVYLLLDTPIISFFVNGSVIFETSLVSVDDYTIDLPVRIDVGETKNVSIVVTTASGAQRTYTITVNYPDPRPRSEGPPTTPPPGSNRGTIAFYVTDTCNDRRRVEFRFFESVNSRLTGRRWPADNRIYYTGGFNEQGVSRLACTVGTNVCYGAKIDGRNWQGGVGLEGNRTCTRCCRECTDPPNTVRLSFPCP